MVKVVGGRGRSGRGEETDGQTDRKTEKLRESE